ncbi:MAG: multicomponent Na+:H+ antiporter subunit C [Parvibaculaceae bacterium]|jgi:multicomponent Na+:H+ antiporter subunit C|nr:cation:proton antiporter subunit C [Parvibaculaceae bacterium]
MEDLTFDFIIARYNYWLVITLMMTGFYVVVSRGNLIKKIVGLNLFQTSVFMLYISAGKIIGGTAPIFTDNPDEVYSNPLPHVLILTAIVVGVATTALGLALIIRIKETFGSIEEDELLKIEHDYDTTGKMPTAEGRP